MSKMINKQVMGILVIIVGVILLPILSTSIGTATSALGTGNAQTNALLGILPLVFTVGLVVFGVYSFIQGMRESSGGGGGGRM